MSKDNLKRLHELEETAEKLKESKIRYSERMNILRKRRDKYVKELEILGINPKTAEKQLEKMEAAVDAMLKKIEDQIPPNLEELLVNSDDNS